MHQIAQNTYIFKKFSRLTFTDPSFLIFKDSTADDDIKYASRLLR